MNIMSFAQMEFVFNLPKVSNTQTLRTFYLMYVFQKGGIQHLKIDIYANFIYLFFFFEGKNLIQELMLKKCQEIPRRFI